MGRSDQLLQVADETDEWDIEGFDRGRETARTLEGGLWQRRRRMRAESHLTEDEPASIDAEPACITVPLSGSRCPRPPIESDHDTATEGALDMSKQEAVARIMRDVHQRVGDVEDVVIATRDGLPLASTTSEDRAEKVAAMVASVLSLSMQAVDDDAEGPFGHTVIRGSRGCLVVQDAGPNAVIAVHTGAKPNMGLVQVEIPRAAADLESILD